MLSRRVVLALPIVALVLPRAARAQVGTALPWMGIEIEAGTRGVLIKGVREGTPAAGAGLKAGDEVLALGGKPVKKPQELIDLVQEHGVGTTVVLTVLRDGKEIEISLKLAARPDEAQMLRDQLLGKPAPGFALGDKIGKAPASLEGLKGQVVLLEFWATWCGPCRTTLPTLADWQKKYGKKGLCVLGVSSEDLPTLKAFADKHKLGHTIASDTDAKMHQAYGVPAVPTIVVIDKGGVVRFAEVGAGDNLAAAELTFLSLLGK